MKVYKYKQKSQARRKQKSMKRAYGYRPALFTIHGPHRNVRYVIVKPAGLRRIK